ncbi:hypothetical protein [Streptomyces sp. NPDC058964]|uniref:hypothetical protein n=1 Tax=Streptomyces sp. NPDC058964 TaxID=3346681 RepID=UPI003694B05F
MISLDTPARRSPGPVLSAAPAPAAVTCSLAGLLTCHVRLPRRRELVRVRLVAEAARRVLQRPTRTFRGTSRAYRTPAIRQPGRSMAALVDALHAELLRRRDGAAPGRRGRPGG